MANAMCSVDGCTKAPRQRRVTGPCEMHYYRMRRTGSYERTRPWHRRTTCSVGGCDAVEALDGMCAKHSTRARRHGNAHIRLRTGAPAGPHHPSRKQIVRYGTLHQRLAREHGRAAEYPCVDCGQQAAQWSYDHLDDDELVSATGLPYSLSPTHYEPRCNACHLRFDGVLDSALAARAQCHNRYGER